MNTENIVRKQPSHHIMSDIQLHCIRHCFYTFLGIIINSLLFDPQHQPISIAQRHCCIFWTHSKVIKYLCQCDVTLIFPILLCTLWDQTYQILLFDALSHFKVNVTVNFRWWTQVQNTCALTCAITHFPCIPSELYRGMKVKQNLISNWP